MRSVMSYLPTFLLALVLAAAPVVEVAGFDGQAHRGDCHTTEGHAAASHAAGGQTDESETASKGEDCDETRTDLCCDDDEVACISSYLPGRAPGQAVLTAASAPLLLGHDSDPDLLFHEYDPPPPRA